MPAAAYVLLHIQITAAFRVPAALRRGRRPRWNSSRYPARSARTPPCDRMRSRPCCTTAFRARARAAPRARLPTSRTRRARRPAPSACDPPAPEFCDPHTVVPLFGTDLHNGGGRFPVHDRVRACVRKMVGVQAVGIAVRLRRERERRGQRTLFQRNLRPPFRRRYSDGVVFGCRIL